MKVGDKLPDTHCELRSGMLKLVIDITDRMVLRRETISTPAGTFDCIVTRQHKVEDAPLHHVDTWSDSWYAPGIGYVRYDILDKDNEQLLASEILVRRSLK